MTYNQRPTTILGIDPGLQHTGWAVIQQTNQHFELLGCATISPPKTLPLWDRLGALHAGLVQVIGHYKPQEAAIEETFVNVNASSTLKLGQARGGILLSLSLSGLPVAEYAPTLVKKTVTGVGRASKDQIAMMVATLMPQYRDTLMHASEDARDAVAIAICHAHHAKQPGVKRAQELV